MQDSIPPPTSANAQVPYIKRHSTTGPPDPRLADSEDVEPVCIRGQLHSSQSLGSDRRDFTRTALSPCCTLPPLVSRRGWLFVPLCQRLNFYKKFLLFLIKKKKMLYIINVSQIHQERGNHSSDLSGFCFCFEREKVTYFPSPALGISAQKHGLSKRYNSPYSLSWGS